jgi:PIN domain nuclease of toxin-antitoxin system
VKYIFDTHAWYWAVTDPERFPRASRRLLRPAPNEPIGLSAISLWELCKLVQKRRVEIHLPLLDWMMGSLDPAFVEVVPLSARIAAASVELPADVPRDPADQIIVAPARLSGAALITKDDALRALTHLRTIWD